VAFGMKSSSLLVEGSGVWIVHASPNPKRGLVEGAPRQVAILAAEKAINRWWKQRHGLDAARTIRANGGSPRSLPE
jgi:hypothetical protein